MIETARAQHGRAGIEFVHESLEDIGPELGSFDVVASRMALHYLARIGPVIATIRGLVRPGGRLVFSVSHPVITSHAQMDDGRRTDCTVDPAALADDPNELARRRRVPLILLLSATRMT